MTCMSVCVYVCQHTTAWREWEQGAPLSHMQSHTKHCTPGHYSREVSMAKYYRQPDCSEEDVNGLMMKTSPLLLPLLAQSLP